jgi:hypothetical protein
MSDFVILTPKYVVSTIESASAWLQRLHEDAEVSWHTSTGAGVGTWEGQVGSTTPPPYLRMLTTRSRAYLAWATPSLQYDRTPQEIGLTRVYQACDYLLRTQQADGRWESSSTTSAGSTIDDVFDTAECGEVLCLAAMRFGIPAFGEAAYRAAQWLLTGQVAARYADAEYYAEHPDDPPFLQLLAFQNANFIGTILRHLSALFRLIPDPIVEQAIRRGVLDLLAWQQADGTWFHYGDYPGGVTQGSQVKSMVYHDLTVVGLVAASTLPIWLQSERDTLVSSIYKAVNYAIKQQVSSGLVLLRPDLPTPVVAGAWSVVSAVRHVFQNPTSQSRGFGFWQSQIKAFETVAWQGTGKSVMETRMLMLRVLTDVLIWQTWWER